MTNKVVGVGIDVSAYKLDIAILNTDAELLSTDQVESNAEGFKKLFRILSKQLNAVQIVFEATGIYSNKLVRFLNELHFSFECINPLVARQLSTGLRQNKTDRVDAIKLARIAISDSFQPSYVRDEAYEKLYQLDRWYENENRNIVIFKNRFDKIQQQTFPVKGFPVSKDQSLFYELFIIFPHADWVLRSSLKQVTEKLKVHLSKQHPRTNWGKYAKLLHSYAVKAVPSVISDAPNSKYLIQLGHQILTVMDTKAQLIKNMIEIGSTFPAFKYLCSIPGIAETSAIRIIAEIGDISRFDNTNQINAFIGIDLRHFESGLFTGSDTISKRGNKIARKLLYQCVFQIVQTCTLTHKKCHIADYYYYQTKKQSSSPKKTAIACIHRLLRTIYGMCKYGESYQYKFHKNQLIQ